MSSETTSALLELGFDNAKVERAVKATNNAGVDAALDWLEKYGDSPPDETDTPKDPPQAHPPDVHGSKIMAKGLKCTICDILFKSQALASYHSEKSSHTNFEEVEYEDKPLTEEERRERLEKLRDQLAVKRLAKQKLEAEEAKANEAIRRKGGKDMASIKEDLKKKEIEKEIAQRKKDKLEDEKAKARARAAIEEDKKERARKAALEKSKRLGLPPPQEAPMIPKTPQSVITPTCNQNSHREGRFQLRLPGPEGSVVILTLDAEKTLFDLRDALLKHPQVANESYDGARIRFSTTYPRKVFTVEEMARSVKELGLLPSVALVISYT